VGTAAGRWRRLGRIAHDEGSCIAAWAIAKHWTAQERQALRDDVPQLGFKAGSGTDRSKSAKGNA